jgi:hypothetical protein
MEIARKAQRILRPFASIYSLYADITNSACFFELNVSAMLQFVYKWFRKPTPEQKRPSRSEKRLSK